MKHNELEKMEGIVTAVHRERYELEVKDGKIYAKLKTNLYFYEKENILFPTVGDHVELLYNPTGDSLIISTLKRKSWFSRMNPTPGMGEQVVAANFDYVFIMMSLNEDFNLKKLDRYIASAWQSGGTPVIILTKADMKKNNSTKPNESSMDQIEEFTLESWQLEMIRLAKDNAIGIDVHVISSYNGYGMEGIQKYISSENTIVFLGSSGVGKSTFVNYLLGNEVMKTAAVREYDSSGRHTTTHRQMLLLKTGARIIDTPGMRELGLWDTSEGLNHTYEDIEDIISRCKFSNCTHKNEIGCAVNEAKENGSLSESRWNNYVRLMKENEHIKNKSIQRDQSRRNPKYVKQSKKNKF